VKPATDSAVRAVPEPIKLNGSLEIAAGFGIRASLENGTLQLEQDRQQDDMIYTHTISLAPHEARELIDFVERHVNQDRTEETHQ
jgi:hypothetical protein